MKTNLDSNPIGYINNIFTPGGLLEDRHTVKSYMLKDIQNIKNATEINC